MKVERELSPSRWKVQAGARTWRGKGWPLRYQTAQATQRGARGFAELNKVGPTKTGLTAGYGGPLTEAPRAMRNALASGNLEQNRRPSSRSPFMM